MTTVKVISDHAWGPVLGEGSWGKVRQCFHLSSRTLRAVKILYRIRLQRKIRQGVERLQQEYQLVQSLHHPNIIQYYQLDEVSNPEKIYLFMELCSRGSILRNIPTRGLDRILFIREKFIQLLEGLWYLHQEAHVAHHDVKSDNILLNDEGIVKICDFGIAERFSLTQTNMNNPCQCFFGTPAYQPPEVVSNTSGDAFDGAAADMWSAGVILYQMILYDRGGEEPLPFTGETVYLLYKSIEGDPVPFPCFLSQDEPLLDDLLKKLLDKDPIQRITAKEALVHPFFQVETTKSRQILECCTTL